MTSDETKARLWILVTALVLMPGAVASVLAQSAIATVSVDVQKPGEVIPADFEGLSIQFDASAENDFRGAASSPAYVLGGASAPNLVFYQFIKNLGHGTLRTNCGLPSEPCWNSSESPFPEACPHPLTDDLVSGYAKASAATGWGIIAELNLAQNSPAWALQFGARFVQAVRAAPGSKLTGFEFGNEPDLYSSETLFARRRIRPPNYSWRDLVKEWRAYIEASKSNPVTADVPLLGPAYDSGGWTTPTLGSFIEGVGAKNLAMVTVHQYPLDVCGGKVVSIADLLSAGREEEYLREAKQWVQAAHQRGLPIALGESNSVACEGARGVSDVFASTVWGLDWLFANAQIGMRHLFFHLNNSYYSPVFVTTYRNPDDGALQYANFVAPLYYAMYAFSAEAEGKRLLPVTLQTSSNIRAYAVRAAGNGPVTVFVINKDLKAAGKVRVELSAPMHDAHLLVVRAPSLESKEVSYGGTLFDNQTGLLAGKPQLTTVTPDASGGYEVELGNASIAVLSIKP